MVMNNITKLLEGFGGLDKRTTLLLIWLISDGQTRVLEALQQKHKKQ
jgi:hypothetical protein